MKGINWGISKNDGAAVHLKSSKYSVGCMTNHVSKFPVTGSGGGLAIQTQISTSIAAERMLRSDCETMVHKAPGIIQAV